MKSADLGRLFLLAALWGGSFIFIRVSAPALGPVVLVEVRVLIAGITLLFYALLTRQALGLRRWWWQYWMIGVLNSAIPFALISTAELHLTASLAAILNATSPLFGAFIAAVWAHEPLTLRKLIGIALGMAGVTIVTGWSTITFSEIVLISIGASLLAAAFYGLAGVFIKRRAAGAPALGIAVGSQLGAAITLAPLVPITLPSVWPSAIVVLCVLALALLSTALAYVLYFRLISDVGPTRALTVTFLIPIFGSLWGMLFLGEQLAISTLLGSCIILAGTLVVTGVPIQLLHPLPSVKVNDGL